MRVTIKILSALVVAMLFTACGSKLKTNRGTPVDKGASEDGNNIQSIVRGAAGAADNTFGTAGIFQGSSYGIDDAGGNVVQGTDGKTYSGGNCHNGVNHDICVVRLTANGTADTSFGSNGRAMVNFGELRDHFGALVLDGDKPILVGRTERAANNWDWAIARFKSDGTLDTSFGTGGKIIRNMGSLDEFVTGAVVVGTKLIVSGYILNGSNIYVANIAAFELSTGAFLWAKGDAYPSHFVTKRLVATADGKFMAAGYWYNTDNWNFAISRYNSDGTLDTTFSGDGHLSGLTFVATGNTGHDYANSLEVMSDGRIISVGYSQQGGRNFAAIARMTALGFPDTTFGINGLGTVLLDLGGAGTHSLGQAIHVDDDGKIYVGGHFYRSATADNYAGNDRDSFLARLNTDGSYDTSFGTAGKKIFDLNGKGLADGVNSILIDKDRRLITTGWAFEGTSRLMALSRWWL